MTCREISADSRGGDARNSGNVESRVVECDFRQRSGRCSVPSLESA